MKKHHLVLATFFIFLLSMVVSVTQSSCSKQKDACSGVVCQHNGTCAEGKCTCPTGFTGANCETPYSAGFAGTYLGSDSGSLASDTIIIASDTGAYAVTINAITNKVTFKGSIKNDTLTVPTQTVTSGLLTYTVSGNGVFNLPNTQISYTAVTTTTTHVVFTGRK